MYGAAADGSGGAGDRKRVRSGEDFSIFLEKKLVSDRHLRQEKNCLNCGATVEERYCTRCGQENVEPKESVGHLIGHFFADITHFDSKIFTTLKDLIFRPGFLTSEYVSGRRMRYLNPIRMYVFISAIFFLALYADKGEEDGKVNNADSVNVIRQQIAYSLRRAGGDSGHRASNLKLAAKLDTAGKDSAKTESLSVAYTTGGIVKADITERKYNTVREYDSVQRKLPDSAKAKGIMKWILRNNVRMKEKYGTSVIHKEVDIRHDIPKVMFVLLPLFALYVGWLYSRKKYYYVQHAIFSVHFHCFYFLLFLVLLLVGILIRTDWYELLSPMVAVVAGYFYLVVALRNRFRQSWMTSFLKGTAIAALYVVTVMVAFTGLMVLTFVAL